eukprot:m.808695 g.808695  ORF g.808695 m.808695 type:complete len:83 (+) comp59315_c0_seq2:1247-1495(+)
MCSTTSSSVPLCARASSLTVVCLVFPLRRSVFTLELTQFCADSAKRSCTVSAGFVFRSWFFALVVAGGFRARSWATRPPPST